jgi:hypothetical protein
MDWPADPWFLACIVSIRVSKRSGAFAPKLSGTEDNRWWKSQNKWRRNPSIASQKA